MTQSIQDPDVHSSETAWPSITVLIPTLNAARDLALCLTNLQAQDYPRDKLAISVIDDDSIDDTRRVAEEFGATLLRNGAHNIERGKSIGLENAESDLIFLLDSDNRFPATDWLRSAARILRDRPEVVGVQAARFSYVVGDPAINRYCSLFGVGDPVAYYFNKRDHLNVTETAWTLSGTLAETTPDAFYVDFTRENMPTIGSQGFLIRRSDLLTTNWSPALFHVDSNLELVMQGKHRYAFLQRDVTHDYVTSVRHLLKKLERNATLYYAQRHEREHVWVVSKSTLLRTILTMITVAVPLRDALRVYSKQRDMAAFLHPILCFYVPFMYAALAVRSRLRPFSIAPRT